MTTLAKFDLYALRLLGVGRTLDEGLLGRVSPRLGPAIEYIGKIKPRNRREAIDSLLFGLGNRDAALEALSEIDPEGPPPDLDGDWADGPISGRELLSGVEGDEWSCPWWIGQAALTGVGAFEGVGKSRLFADWMRRVFLGLPWHDGQAQTGESGRRMLWLCSDGNHDEIARLADDMGVLDALLFNGSREDPYGFTDLDDGETIKRLEQNIIAASPWAVVIDTLTNATSLNLCSQSDVKRLCGPLKDLAQRHRIPIILSMHLNRDGNILGRRLRGWCRTILKLECPDEKQSGRLALSVFKTYAKKPAPLGVTMGDHGNEYSFEVPSGPDKGGRPDDKTARAREYIVAALRKVNDRPYGKLIDELVANEVCSKGTAFEAVRALASEGLVVIDESRKPKVLHLVEQAEDDEDPVILKARGGVF